MLTKIKHIFTHLTSDYVTVIAGVQKRTLLSPAFQCNTEWNSRLNEPAMSKASAELLITQLFVEFDKNEACSAVDMEVVCINQV